jgi:hypothetical protein
MKGTSLPCLASSHTTGWGRFGIFVYSVGLHVQNPVLSFKMPSILFEIKILPMHLVSLPLSFCCCLLGIFVRRPAFFG